MTNLTTVATYYQTIWSEFRVKSHEVYETDIVLSDVYLTDAIIMIALNDSSYNGYDNKGYGIGFADRGITEQEAYDIWIQQLQKEQTMFRKQLINLKLDKLPQCVYDGLFYYYWVTGNFLNVHALEGIYETRNVILEKDWDTLASMIMRDSKHKFKAVRAATIIRLADYGKYKSRTWLRTRGIYDMRAKNEIGLIKNDQLKRARFAYYAETESFLPRTPESIKRDIVKRYKETLITQQFIYTGTNTFTLLKSPSMSPVEKLIVKLNGVIIQHYFDYTVDGNTLTVTKTMSNSDVISTIIKI